MSIKYFNVSTVGIVCSLKPIITCVIAVLMVGETMSGLDVLSNGLGLLAILLVIVGTPATADSGAVGGASNFAFLALISQPVLLAVGDVLIKKMKKLPEEPVSFAQGVALCLFASTCMLCTGESFGFVAALSPAAWAWLCLTCVLTILSQMAKKKAIDNYELAQLQKVNNMSSFWQFLVDMLLLHIVFSGMQFLGFAVLFLVFSAEVTKLAYSLRYQK
jgi:drug/metabolite transporter (DMT)-like permease